MLIRVPLDRVTQILHHQMNFSSPVGSFNLHAALPALGEDLFSPLYLSLSLVAAKPTQTGDMSVGAREEGDVAQFCLFLTGVKWRNGNELRREVSDFFSHVFPKGRMPMHGGDLNRRTHQSYDRTMEAFLALCGRSQSRVSCNTESLYRLPDCSQSAVCGDGTRSGAHNKRDTTLSRSSSIYCASL